MKTLVLRIVIVLILGMVPGMAESADSEGGWSDAGLRLGIQAGPKREYFHLYEIFSDYDLPWKARSPSGWGWASQLTTAVGVLHKSTDTGVMASLGTGLVISKSGYGLTPEFGISLNLMNRRQFGNQDFGSILLFGAYAGLSYHFDSGLGIEYRILHLSNNHILYSKNTPNPGVDMHQISISWNF